MVRVLPHLRRMHQHRRRPRSQRRLRPHEPRGVGLLEALNSISIMSHFFLLAAFSGVVGPVPPVAGALVTVCLLGDLYLWFLLSRPATVPAPAVPHPGPGPATLPRRSSHRRRPHRTTAPASVADRPADARRPGAAPQPDDLARVAWLL
jgi:hypothetical protein